jgi:hypothetical protein
MIMSKQRLVVYVCALVCIATGALVLPGVASAQGSLTIKKPLTVGACEVVVEIPSPRAGDQVGLVVELTQYREQTVIAGRRELKFVLSEPLRQGFRVRARLNGADVPSASEVVPPGAGGRDGTCEAPEESDETPFDASAFLGEVVDNFAPDNVAGYVNPAAGSGQKAQFIAGFDFDYRIYGRADSPVRVWLQGETMHGVRTADVDCKPPDGSAVPPVCVQNGVSPNASEQIRYILENATSVEAYVNPRVEFLKIQRNTDSSAWVYATAHIGFIALKDAPSVFRAMHLGLGVLADEGNFAGSYVEVGWGRNELFSPRWNRLEIDGLLSFSLEKLPLVRDNGRLFVEMTVDNDLHNGPDSVRTFFGVDIDLRKAVGQ